MKSNFFMVLILLLLAGSGLSAQEKAVATSGDNEEKIAMYYFHTSFRCTTCRTVEEQSKLAFESLYPVEFKSGTASFQAVNIEEDEGQNLVEKFKITGQTLLVVKGDKTSDLTSQGFLYAKTNPDKLKEEIKDAIENL